METSRLGSSEGLGSRLNMGGGGDRGVQMDPGRSNIISQGNWACLKDQNVKTPSASHPRFGAGIRELCADSFSKNLTPSPRQVPGLDQG